LPHYIWQKSNWPKLRWQSDRLLDPLGRARLRQGKLLSQAAALGFDLEQQAQAEILTEEAVKTAAIEGEEFDRESVRSSVQAAGAADRRPADGAAAGGRPG